MKIRLPAKVIEVCDVCRDKGNFLQDCDSCGRKYCLSCEGVMIGCILSTDVCRSCAKQPEVEKVVKKFVPAFTKAKEARTAALKQLRPILKRRLRYKP